MILYPNFMFAHLEKTAGTTMEFFLGLIPSTTRDLEYNKVGYVIDINRRKKYVNPNCRSKICRHDAMYRHMPTNKEVYKFGYIRNPYDWYLSLWSYSRDGREKTYKHLFNEERSKDDLNIFIDSMFNNTFALCYYSNTLLMDTSNYALPHIDFTFMNELDIGLLTYRYLYMYYHPDVFGDIENYKKYKLADRIIEFERLIKNIVEVLNYCKVEIDMTQLKVIPQMRASNHGDRHDNYYTQETIDVIKHKDRIIFAEHEYGF